MRRITFVGNCQALAMSNLYRRFAAPGRGDRVDYVASYENPTEQGRRAIAEADLVVEQLFGVAPQVDLGELRASAPRVLLPNVSAAFLWPHAGHPHPHNRSHSSRVAGPFVGEVGDSFLNRLVLEGVDAEEAVARYLALDIARKANLDRLYELVIDRQRARDQAAGYHVADAIERHLRDEQIFLTPHHPNLRITLLVATELFRQLGAAADEIALMERCTTEAPFPREELPVHPGVARHFGLSWAPEDRLYRFMQEDRVTFAEYARRYVLCAWNEALAEGLSLAHAGETERAEVRLREGLARTPESGSGWNALSRILDGKKQHEAAIAAARRAVEAEPDMASFHANLGWLLRSHGDLREAEDSLRRAIALQPGEAHTHLLLGHLLRRAGRFGEAAESFGAAAQCDPYAPRLHAEHAVALEMCQAWDAAERARRRAATLAPDEPVHQRALADVLVRLGRTSEAIDVLDRAAARLPAEQAIVDRLAALRASEGPRDDTMDAAASAKQRELEERLAAADRWERQRDRERAIAAARDTVARMPDEPRAQAQLGRLLLQAGRFAEAEQPCLWAAALDPDDPHLQHQLSVVSERLNRPSVAIAAARRAMMLDPHRIERVLHLAGLFSRSDDRAGAERVLRDACERHASDPRPRTALSRLHWQAGRRDDALAFARAAVACDPANADAHAQLGFVLLHVGDPEGAEVALRRSLDLQRAPQPLHDLSSLLVRTGRFEEAIDAAREAAALQPDVAHRHAHLAHVLRHAQQWEAAAEAVRRALELRPGDMAFRQQLEDTMKRLAQRAPAQGTTPQRGAREGLALEGLAREGPASTILAAGGA